ncbi:MAG: PVC-type heme-binding CxxCH protein [Chthoniobacteraceae bacterium]
MPREIHPLIPVFALAFTLSVTAGAAGGAKAFTHEMPPIDLPDGYVAEVVAAPPLVRHPIMATIDDRGRLFVGDSSGVNLKKDELEKELPHRVLMLEDANGDGVYDKSTVFADRMTFPQGGAWLGGSLYVMSPPGLWKFTDSDGDGVADKRERIVSGFEYTGNAADVHGPFVHPNGRLYWCHGRKGHKVVGKEGAVVHEGLASGIWSCRPDGSEVRWHSLGCGDNPVEVDFTPEGEILGVQNIFYTNPRGDTIVHWLRGGIYPRPDQLKAIEGLPRTLDTMPVVHNYGHVGVSGCTFYRSGALDPEWRGNLFVTHFNTQRLTRMEVARDGASYKVTEREFLKLRNPDVHLTDVLEDRDGSLLVVDTGGWFRIGCPSSLMAKPDIPGAIYRVRKAGAPAKCEPWGAGIAGVWKKDEKALIAALGSKDASAARAAGNALAMKLTADAIPALLKALARDDAGVQLAAAHALGALPKLDARTTGALLRHIGGEVDRSVEHQAMFALLTAGELETIAAAFRDEAKPALQQRLLTVLDQRHELTAERVTPLLDSSNPALARKAAEILLRHGDWPVAARLTDWLRAKSVTADRLALIELLATPRLATMPEVIPLLLERKEPAAQRAAWRVLAAGDKPPVECAPALQKALGSAAPADLPLVLAAAAKVSTPGLRTAMREFSDDARQPLSLRLKALGASLDRGKPLPAESFDLLTRALADASPSARLEAVRTLVSAKLAKEQLLALPRLIPALGPLELAEILKGYRAWLKTDAALPFAQALKDSAALASVEESHVRTIFSDAPPAIFAEIAPALQALAADDASRRRMLETLPARIAKEGRASEGRKLFESGAAACSTCHRIGEVGNLVGPNLSTIGGIRVERDLLESILFPSNSLARDYEAHAIETADGRSLMGVIRASLPDVLVFADAGAQEHRIPHSQITAKTTLATSLMPQGLDKALSSQQLMDLIAYLRSRK